MNKNKTDTQSSDESLSGSVNLFEVNKDDENSIDETEEINSEEDEYSEFRTKDLSQAAYMWCQPGAKLKRLDGQTGKGTTIFFVFQLPISEMELGALVINYANQDALVCPLTFSQKHNQLRDLLHSTLGKKRIKN